MEAAPARPLSRDHAKVVPGPTAWQSGHRATSTPRRAGPVLTETCAAETAPHVDVRPRQGPRQDRDCPHHPVARLRALSRPVVASDRDGKDMRASQEALLLDTHPPSPSGEVSLSRKPSLPSLDSVARPASADLESKPRAGLSGRVHLGKSLQGRGFRTLWVIARLCCLNGDPLRAEDVSRLWEAILAGPRSEWRPGAATTYTVSRGVCQSGCGATAREPLSSRPVAAWFGTVAREDRRFRRQYAFSPSSGTLPPGRQAMRLAPDGQPCSPRGTPASDGR